MVQVPVTVIPVVAAVRNARRKTIVLYNASVGGQIISIGKDGAAGLAALNREYVLNPATGLAFILEFDGPDIQGEWGAYSSAAGGVLVVGETSERDGV